MSTQLFFPFRGTLFTRVKLSLFTSSLPFKPFFPSVYSKQLYLTCTPPNESVKKVNTLFHKRWGNTAPKNAEQFHTAVRELHQEILETLKLFSSPIMESTEKMTHEITCLQECFSESCPDEYFSLYHILTKKAEKMQACLEDKLHQLDTRIAKGAPKITGGQLETLREISSVGYENLKTQTEKATAKIQEKLIRHRLFVDKILRKIEDKLEQLHKTLELCPTT